MITRQPVAPPLGAVRLTCPDRRCRYAITKLGRAAAERAIEQHLEADARHTGGSWVDMEGRERIGFDYA